jgi:16S rRNA processing protein RimM
LGSAVAASGQGMTAGFVVLGRISGLHGVRGELKVYAETRERADILKYEYWHLRRPDGWQKVRLLGGHVQGSGVVVAQLEGVTDRDAARALIGTEIAIRREELPPAEPGTYYWADLEGLEVVNLEGVVLGTVSHLFETGANDVLVVVDGERERLIPYTRDAVKQVDLEARVIRVDWDPDF